MIISRGAPSIGEAHTILLDGTNDLEYESIGELNELRRLHNFRGIINIVGENRLKGIITTLYPRFSVTEIETITGIPKSTVGYWLEHLELPRVRCHIFSSALAGDSNSQVIVAKGVTSEKVVTFEITPELAYVIGFALGDGSVQKWSVEVFNKDRALRQVLFNHLKQYGSITEDMRENGLWRIRLSNGKIANLIKNEKGIREDTLGYIFAHEELAERFIAAFWDAEGSVLRQYNYYHIYLYNSNKHIIGLIIDFLKKKDIKFSIHERKTRDTPYTYQGHIIKSKKSMMRINIHKVSWADWIKVVGVWMRHPKKRKMIEEIMRITS